MPDPGLYTIGWVCATAIARTAAKFILDEVHDDLDATLPNDTNSYLLGKVGVHNVVICVLPSGEYGISTASSCATNMLRTFPNIRFGLMVGIGGGAPTPEDRNRDIRLGDIVVSSPFGGCSGVMQYDYGRAIQGRHFQTTLSLNNPPQFVRSAIEALKSEYMAGQYTLQDEIDRILANNPEATEDFERPDSSNDRLFESYVLHPGEKWVACIDHCAKPESNMKTRKKRPKFWEGKPRVFYGIIASANRVMKDANVRDKFAREKNVLCFEMEAAGLMNIFPFLIIRGISNYSDTHKNDDWKGYASLAAAVYAKDLLSHIPPQKVKAQENLSQVLNGQ